MNPIANKKEAEILDYLSSDIGKTVDTNASRCYQQKGIEIFAKTSQLLKKAEENALNGSSFDNIFGNSFSNLRSDFDEYRKISLTSKERK